MRRSAVCLSLLLVLALSFVAFAQNYTGTIRGTVTDSSKAVVPSAPVTIVNTATGATRNTQTSQTGEYVVPDLPAGTYEVRVKQAGFKEFLARTVELHVSSTAVVNAELQLGNATEQVTVEANAVQVQTASAQLGEIVNGQQVRELPLNGRSFAQLTLLQPGVSARDALNTRDKGLLSGVDMAVNGNPVTNNLWLLDGANNNDLGSNRTILIYPSIDAIAEFNFLRNSYGPEYGQASGGIVSIVTRSGSNQFHGSVFYFGRNDKLNATEYFARRAETAAEADGTHLINNGKDVLRRNDWGYAVGGPIKKDKLFFFWSQEWNHEKRGNTRQACVPTLAERNGDFSTVSCGAKQPHLPGNAAVPMTNLNQIPGFTGLDPAGRLLADLLPLPNITAGEKNWFQSLSSPIRWRQENVRVDYHLTSKHTATFRYTQDTWSNPSPTPQPKYWGDDIFPAVEGNWSQPSKSIIGKFTSVLTNTLTNDAQFSYSNNRIDASLGGTGTQGHGASELSPPELVAALNAAIPTVFPESLKKPGGMPPDAAWGGFGPYGDGASLWLIAPWNNSSDLYQFRDDIAKVYNNHTFKVGFFYGYNGKNEPSEGGHDRPQFSLGDSVTGNPLADALIPGTVYGMDESSVNLFPHGRWRDIEWYLQDTWKVRRNVTLEYGFRWSFLRQPYELNDQVASWDRRFYDPTKPATDACNGLVIVPGTDPCGQANSTLGTSFSSGTPGVNRALVENSNHNIAPRLGISWDVKGDGKTAVRAGIGQFYQRERVSTVTAVLGQNAPFSLSYHADRTLDVAPTLGVPSGSPTGGRDPSAILPNSWQWNFSVERELARDTSLQVGYVGNRGIHLTSDYDQNAPVPANWLAYTFAADDAARRALRPATNFGGISRFAHTGDSNYHSLQASFRTRLANRTQIQASYTWSHTISNVDLSDSSGSGFDSHTFSTPYDPGFDRGNSEINRPHIFTANAVVYLPSLKGAHPVAQHVLGGWELATIVTAQSGTSIWIKGPRNNLTWVVPGTALTGTIVDPTGTGLATNSGNGNSMRLFRTDVSCSEGRSGSQIFNPAAFTLVGYHLGTIEGSGRGNCLGPKTVNADISLYKNWKLTERLSMQFRFEAFNAFNHAQFFANASGVNTGWFNGNIVCGTAPCSPTNNVITAVVPGSGQSSFVNESFGAATSTRGPRELQYALKFIF